MSRMLDAFLQVESQLSLLDRTGAAQWRVGHRTTGKNRGDLLQGFSRPCSAAHTTLPHGMMPRRKVKVTRCSVEGVELQEELRAVLAIEGPLVTRGELHLPPPMAHDLAARCNRSSPDTPRSVAGSRPTSDLP